jgi:hypothetical protein
MGVKILIDREQDLACLYDSVTDTAFGPVAYGYVGEEFLRNFIQSLPMDARKYSGMTLRAEWDKFLEEHPVK